MPLRKHFEGAVGEMVSVFQEMQHTSDRVAAIACAAVLDDTLGVAISRRLVKMGKDWEDRIFGDPSAPLGTFHAKILLAYAMGLIGPSARSDLDLIRSIRNDFAHSGAPVSFDDPAISLKCNRISFRRNIDEFDYPEWLIELSKKDHVTPRQRFIAACEWLSLDLSIVRPKRLRPIFPRVLR
jgi:hypothetical protein